MWVLIAYLCANFIQSKTNIYRFSFTTKKLVNKWIFVTLP